tara:strand:+ start:237 stop:698 length:462 start_codon:yes stop_codon:yes gene_type:complete
MAQSFILPTIFAALLSIWYFSFLNNLNSLDSLSLHLFTVSGRLFYGLLLSLPFEAVLSTVISRMTVWVFFLILGVDLLKLSSLLNDFNHYVLSDALTLLFSILFIVFDLFFVFSSYRLSTKEQLIARCTVEENKKAATALQTVQPQALKFTTR